MNYFKHGSTYFSKNKYTGIHTPLIAAYRALVSKANILNPIGYHKITNMFKQNPFPKLPSNKFKRHLQNSQIIKLSENSQFQCYITYMSLLLDFGYLVHKVLDPKIYRASIPGLPYAIFTIVLQYHNSPLPDLATEKNLQLC